jgi:glycosyltransferase involved in cell wall biosynthesis
LAATRPTILQIIPSLDTGGAELSTIEITGAIVKSGGRALVATTGGRMAQLVVEAGGELISFPAATKNPLQIWSNAGRLATLIKLEGVDLIHARSRAPAWSALIAARRTKIAFVTTYHGAYAESNALKKAYNHVMACGDVVIANSAYTARLIQSRYATPTARLRVIHRGVDPVGFAGGTVEPLRISSLRESWGVTPDQRIILQAARLTRWKGQAVLIDAMAALRKAAIGLDAVIILAGDDQGRTDYSNELRRQITALGLDGHVRLVGHVADMAAAFASATVTVIASTDAEAFGRTSIEAQLMGCPVIATAIGAPPETVLAPPTTPDPDRTGWLIPPGEAPALASALRDALALNPLERAALGERARHHVSANFTLDAMKRATLRVYDDLLKTHLVQSFLNTNS